MSIDFMWGYQNKVKAKKKLSWFKTVAAILLTIVFSNSSLAQKPSQKIRLGESPAQIPVGNGNKTGVKANETKTGQIAVRDTFPAVDSFNLKISKDTLSDPVTYHADDSAVIDVPNKKLYLFGKKSNVDYQDNSVSAPRIDYDQGTGVVRAAMQRDDSGRVVSFARIKQGDFTSTNDTIYFNIRSRKGITKGTYTQQGEMFVYSEKIKKASDDVFFAYQTRFTTCNYDTPHFAFVSKKVKFVNKEWAYTGPVHPEFEGVPVPIVLPFGIFPLKNGRRSGLLPPTFNSDDRYGLSLSNLGYYKIFTQNLDVIARGSIFSYGGWSATLNPRYFKRYRYSGDLMFTHSRMKELDEPAPKDYELRWSHNADTRARPGVTFSAFVNLRSSKFSERLTNRVISSFQNTASSSINYSKTWRNKPFNLSVNANHDQNNYSGDYHFSLPVVNFTMNSIYPLRAKEGTGNLKWYENLGIGLNSQVDNQTGFNGFKSAGFKQMADNLRWSVVHNIPISLSLPPLGPLQFTSGISYREMWIQNKLALKWNPQKERTDTAFLHKGFYTQREMTYSVTMGTRIFGLFVFGKNSKINAIRHQISPTISFNVHPELNKNSFYILRTDSAGTLARVSYFQPGSGTPVTQTLGSKSISFGIDNNIMMKVRSKKDTTNGGLVKVPIFDQLSLSGSYNLSTDSFRMSPISISASTNLFNKVTLSISGSLSPYAKGPDGRIRDQLIWTQNPFTFGKLTSGNISMSSSFRGGDKNKSGLQAGQMSGISKVDRYGNRLTPEEEELAYINNNPSAFTDFDIPWDVSLNYSLYYSHDVYNRQYPGPLAKTISQDITLNGSINLTPKWKLGGQMSFSIDRAEIGMSSLFITRDMHCWQMSINTSPVGRYKYFGFTISPKSGLLQDVKINRTRSYYDDRP